MRWLTERPRLTYAALFLLGFAVIALVSGDRLDKQSSDPHFVMQADAWLHGRLDIGGKWKGDDPAIVETVQLRDGRLVRGRYLRTRSWIVDSPWFEKAIAHPSPHLGPPPMVRMFRTTTGRDIPIGNITKRLGHKNYVSFPPTPAIAMIPFAIMQGRRANDVFPTVLFAALILPLCLATLRRLSAEGISNRSDSENIWLTLQLSFGTVLFFVSVAGRVWFTAHVIGVALALCYAYFSIGARRPIVAGIMLAMATLTRTPMAFMFPFFALESMRSVCGPNWLSLWRRDFWAQSKAHGRSLMAIWIQFALPILAIGAIAAVNNTLRFDSVGEFGHSFLAVRQQAMIERFGLFDYEYLRRNLSVAFALLPGFSSTAPYIHISLHGLALWFTTPLFIVLLWPRRAARGSDRRAVHRALWITVASIGIPILFYQNSGWAQFGYRFSLDYVVFLVLLLAVSGRPLTRFLKFLIILSMAINLFGALTFGTNPEYYDGGTYGVVVPHEPQS